MMNTIFSAPQCVKTSAAGFTIWGSTKLAELFVFAQASPVLSNINTIVGIAVGITTIVLAILTYANNRKRRRKK